jgi:hypothetical protein
VLSQLLFFNAACRRPSAGGFFSSGGQPLGLRRRDAAITDADSPPTPLQAIGAALAKAAVGKVAKISKLTRLG